LFAAIFIKDPEVYRNKKVADLQEERFWALDWHLFFLANVWLSEVTLVPQKKMNLECSGSVEKR